MKQRIISAAVALAVFVPIIIKGGHWFAYTIALLGIIGLYELAKMKQIEVFNFVGLLASIALLLLLLPDHYALFPVGWPKSHHLFYVIFLILLVCTVFKPEELNFVDVSVLLAGALYIGLGFRFLILIRDEGLESIFYQFIVIWSTDAGAYFFGKFFGKTKLAPDISPNKTVEGSIGGVLTAIIMVKIYMRWFSPSLGAASFKHSYLWLTILISCMGQLGDLVESAYKRYFGVKDSGEFLPGHGGVLDRFDSTIFSSIIYFVWLNISK